MYTALYAIVAGALLLCVCGAVYDLAVVLPERERQRKPRRITVAEWIERHGALSPAE